MISIIICSIDEKKFSTVSAHYQKLLVGEPHEIIRIPDAKSMCEGYNRGFAQAKGDILIFSHDDIEFLRPQHFASTLKEHMQNFDIIGVAGSNLLVSPRWFDAGYPHIFGHVASLIPQPFHIMIFGTSSRVIRGIQVLDGLFLAFRRKVLEQLSWDEQTFAGFHCYDTDMTFRAHLSGFKLAVVNDLPLIHSSDGDYGDNWRPHGELFTRKHAKDIPFFPDRQTRFCIVKVETREDVIEVMTPSFWCD